MNDNPFLSIKKKVFNSLREKDYINLMVGKLEEKRTPNERPSEEELWITQPNPTHTPIKPILFLFSFSFYK